MPSCKSQARWVQRAGKRLHARVGLTGPEKRGTRSSWAYFNNNEKMNLGFLE